MYTLQSPLTDLPGVGKKTAATLGRLLSGDSIRDLLLHLPHTVVDRRPQDYPQGWQQHLGERVTFIGCVRGHRVQGMHRVVLEHADRLCNVVFFGRDPDAVGRMLPDGTMRLVSGRVIEGYHGPEIRNPELVADPMHRPPLFEPIYRMSAGMQPIMLRKLIREAMRGLVPLPEWLPEALLQRFALPDFRTALSRVHFPKELPVLDVDNPARMRLAADELYARHVSVAKLREALQARPGPVYAPVPDWCARVEALLPFSLSDDQRAAVAAIHADLASGRRMFRLLLGDVGSGKTIVAFMAALPVLAAGGQAALMAPTDILARQHFASLQPLCAALNVSSALITGRERGRKRVDPSTSDVSWFVGTHALGEDSLQFRQLGLAIIDEQHRFGVNIRFRFAQKGPAHMLQMSATPIPRTLALMAPGRIGDNASVSLLRGRPPGRKPIVTRLISTTRLDEVMQAVCRQARTGAARVYWVCPLIDEKLDEDTPTADVIDVSARYASLDALLPGQVGMIHGRMSGPEKDAAAEAFRVGAVSILVATSLIEVGLHVPEATVMVIENAERFGLAQLHQLRGRVGRSDLESSCLLLHPPFVTPQGSERLRMMRESDDGFALAEADMRLRGPGDPAGLRQSGLRDLGPIDPEGHAELAEAIEALCRETPSNAALAAFLPASGELDSRAA